MKAIATARIIAARVTGSIGSMQGALYTPQHPTWEGDKIGCQVVDGKLVPTGAYDAVTYEWYWLPQAGTAGRMFALLLAASVPGAMFEYRLAGPDLFWNKNDADAFWSGIDADAFWTPPAYAPYSSPFAGAEDLYQFRLTRAASAAAWEASQLFNVVQPS